MSTLTFQLDAVKFNEVDTDGDRFWAEIEGWDSPEIAVEQAARLDDDGVMLSGLRYQGRPLTITGTGLAGTARDHEDLEKKLADALASLVAADGTLTVDETTVKRAYVRRAGAARLRARGPATIQFEIPLLAPDPRKHADTETSSPFTVADTFAQATYGETNAGNYNAWPTVVLSGVGASPLTISDGVYTVKLNRAADGTNLTVDFGARTVYHGTTDVYDDLDPTSVWFPLVPGSNSITVTRGSSTGTLNVTLKHRGAWV